MTEEEKQTQPKLPINLPQWLVIGGVLAFAYIFFMVGRQVYTPGKGLQIFNLNQSAQQEQIEQTDEKQTVYTFQAEKSDQTPLSLLEDEADVEYQEYDFGVFVESINGQDSNNDYFWALYVNDEFAQKAADRIELQAGDEVQWRWEEVEDNF